MDDSSFFWSKADVRNENECWLWKRSLSTGGYPRYKKGNIYYAHIYAYTITKGAIPDGLELDHTCLTRSCINPNHLEAITHQENMLRGNTFASKQSKQTHCKRNHSLDNSYIHKNRRLCRICRAQASRKFRENGRQTRLG